MYNISIVSNVSVHSVNIIIYYILKKKKIKQIYCFFTYYAPLLLERFLFPVSDYMMFSR